MGVLERGENTASAQVGEDQQAWTVSVGLVVDPGWPAELTQRVAEQLSAELQRRVSGHACWQVCTVVDDLPLDAQDRVPIVTIAHETMPIYTFDLLVCVTDQPRREGTRPVLADISTTHGVGLVSLPSLGGLRTQPHLRAALVHLVGVLTAHRLTGVQTHSPQHYRIHSRPSEWISPIRQVPSAHQDLDMQLALTGIRSRVRLLWGLVRNNRPWRLVPSLSKALAAASGTAAFGVFYPSIWGMAHALSPTRLAGIALFAIAAMIGWLITYNNLWDRPHTRADREKAVLYNLATVATLFIGVCCMYAVLMTVTLLAALAVISQSYLQAQVGAPVGISTYLCLTWLASSMGTVAGALGSSLEGEQAVHQATYSAREQQRRARNHERQQAQEHQPQQS